MSRAGDAETQKNSSAFAVINQQLESGATNCELGFVLRARFAWPMQSGRVVVGGTATLTGLPATVNVSHTEGALDVLSIDTRGGEDTLDSSGFDPATIGLEVE